MSTTELPVELDPTTRTECLELLLAAHDAGTPISRDELVRRIGDDEADAIDAVLAVLVADDDLEPGEDLTLTASGHATACRIVRKHMLAERLLLDVIGVDWSDVHRLARRWETVISDEVEEKLVELLDDPGTCAHGNPLPGSSNRPDLSDAILLSDAPEGPFHVVRIAEALEEDHAALQLLEAAGLTPGAEGEVLAPLGADGVKVAGSKADAVVPPHVASLTYVVR